MESCHFSFHQGRAMKIQPMIVVNNVEKSSRFYQELLRCQSGHGGNEYEMLLSDGELVLQLHARDTHDHPGMFDEQVPVGNGAILWFRTDEFDSAVERARKMHVDVVAQPHINPNANQYEIWLRDPDGYLVVISGNMGEAVQ
jgi:catechol 2,3-dioxygenase-like lactoylglutathione lyase family enzyme